MDQASESLLKSKACFGAENLMRVLGNYCRLGEVRTHIRVGVVGKAAQISMGHTPSLDKEGGTGFGILCCFFGEEKRGEGFRSGFAICSLASGHGKAYSDSPPLEPNKIRKHYSLSELWEESVVHPPLTDENSETHQRK